MTKIDDEDTFVPLTDYESAMVAKLHEAHEHVTFSGLYKHYKSRSKIYKVQGFVVIEATNTVGVLYQAQYGQRLTFVRPLSSWLAEVDVKGKKHLRFKEVEAAA
jgi:hypothetical protein